MHVPRKLQWWLCRNEDAYAASKRLLKMTGVTLRQHQFDTPIVFSLGTREKA